MFFFAILSEKGRCDVIILLLLLLILRLVVVVVVVVAAAANIHDHGRLDNSCSLSLHNFTKYAEFLYYNLRTNLKHHSQNKKTRKDVRF